MPLLARPLILVCILVASACATHPAGAPISTAGWAADAAAIDAALQGSADAWNRADLRGHLGIYVDSVTFMTRNGPRPGVEPIEQAFSQTYWRDGRPIQNLRFEQAVVRRLGPDAALQTGRFVLSGGGQPDQSGWFSLTWVRTPEGWRVVHDHSS
jgi:uncharacterized protein (TIGR02246 family)